MVGIAHAGGRQNAPDGQKTTIGGMSGGRLAAARNICGRYPGILPVENYHAKQAK
jgi:hypothetical protein